MNERDIFIAALQINDPAERTAYLAAACGDDADLRQRVERLLQLHAQAGGFLEQPAVDPLTGPDADPAAFELGPLTEGPGTRLGPYKLLQKLGEGGMGAVWMAEQQEPVRRQVAVKVIKAGMDSAQVLARFEAERQALALMDHPNISRVLDAGATDAGRPYFVMELVKGIPITTYCDHEHLTPRERLELFIPVCQAVQHAHQKGIIHRDLKPSNVLIALYDGKPVPKVIDFGVAKATQQKLTERTMFTAVGQIVGTLEYMAPEQAELNNLDIDTRADIYSLGALLYELLTGTPPFSAKQLRDAGFNEMMRMIREVEPPKPSTKLSSSDELPSLAAKRKLEPKRLTKLVAGELDWIVMKCLEKERHRRYETANGLAVEIQRYLADEPVIAGPPSASYRLRKFVRRNKRLVIAASLVLLALLAGIAGTSWGLIRAEQARAAEAERAEGERLAKLDAEAQTTKAVHAAAAERAANEEARKRLAQIEKANDILASIFETLDPKEIARAERPLQAILVEKLDRAVEQLEGEAIGDPLVVAAMQNKLGLSLLGLGEPAKAIVVFEKARATRQGKLGPDHPDTLTSMNNLALGYSAAGKLDLALPLYEETLKLRKAKSGPDHPHTLTSMGNLAGGYQDAGKLDLALPLLEETLKLMKAKLGPDHPDTLTSMNNLALGYHGAGKLDLALPLYEETLKLRKAKLGPDHLDTLTSMGSLAVGYTYAGKLDLALPLLEETLKLWKAKLGPDHPHTLTSMGNLASGYQDAGKLDLAQPLLEETLKLRKAKLGPDHLHTFQSMNNLAGVYWSAKQLDKSIPLFEDVHQRMQAKLGRNHPDTLLTVANLGVNYKDAGRLAEALPLLEEGYRAAKKYPTLRWVGPPLLDGYVKATQAAQAVALTKELLADARAQWPKHSPQLAGQLATLGRSLLQVKAFAEAEPLLRECLAIREKAIPDDWLTFNTKSMLGGALLGQKKYADAEPLLVAGYQGLKQREAKIPANSKVRLTEALERLVHCYDAWGKPDEAVKWFKELEAVNKK